MKDIQKRLGIDYNFFIFGKRYIDNCQWLLVPQLANHRSRALKNTL